MRGIMSDDKKTKDGDADKESAENPNLLKQLDDTVRVFKTLKELSSNPVQKAIEDKVGQLTVDVIQQAFTRPTGFLDQFQNQIAKNPSLQKMIIESTLPQPIGMNAQEKSSPNNDTCNKDEDIPIYEKLSPEDIYIIRIVGDELEVVENHDGVAIYKMIRLAS